MENRKSNIPGGSTKFYVDQILRSYSVVTTDRVRKYFLSSDKFARLYASGKTSAEAYQFMATARKSHRRALSLHFPAAPTAYSRRRYTPGQDAGEGGSGSEEEQ